ncbi:hypothetical protein CYMTET_30079 [Cymbomonas tetramitiformis]|uniref:SAM-dependent MTase RsmB/NOP-type domain-containing protein n=1 Tax=Cymbomonas tetramitiformis TaxID=36881 RepID=A0AAE0FJT3_9CHLO|nr:hypothetical protein CYMTET_30079 [Cymbomonas tetramitiformis]
MTYSTCSMNPVENEAVVAEALRRCGASVELVDTSALLPTVARRPGVARWWVEDVDFPGKYYDFAEEVAEHRRWRMPPHVFHNGRVNEDGAHDLRRCWRLFPHLQNTGGFFIAVMRKKDSLPAAALQDLPVAPDVFGAEKRLAMKQGLAQGQEEDGDAGELEAGAEHEAEEEHIEEDDVFIPLLMSERGQEVWATLSEFYGIDSTFPTAQLLVRCKSCTNINYVSRDVADVLTSIENVAGTCGKSKDKLMTTTVVSAGIRLFVGCSSSSGTAGLHTRIAGLSGKILAILQERRLACLSRPPCEHRVKPGIVTIYHHELRSCMRLLGARVKECRTREGASGERGPRARRHLRMNLILVLQWDRAGAGGWLCMSNDCGAACGTLQRSHLVRVPSGRCESVLPRSQAVRVPSGRYESVLPRC